MHYEQAIVNYSTFEAKSNSDIIAPMYPGPGVMMNYARNHPKPERPFIMCEYAHAMGNSLGNFKDYWDIIRGNKHAFQGGFIWDFVDQGLRKITAAGDTIYAYGGDFGPANVPTDNNSMSDGVFESGRNPEPEAWEMKNIYQDIHTTWKGDNTISIYNEKFFTGTNSVSLHWEVMVNGIKTQEGKVNEIRVAPQQSITIKLPLKPLQAGEAFLNVVYKQKQEELLVPAGHIIAWEQMPLGGEYKQPVFTAPAEHISVKQDSSLLTLTSAALNAQFDKATGLLSSYTVNGRQIIEPGMSLRPNFWRAPTDNDMGADLQLRLKPWKLATEKLGKVSIKTDTTSGDVIVNVFYNLKDISADLAITYTVKSTGALHVRQQLYPLVNSEMPMLLRFGMKLVLPEGFENISYYGRGPYENYQDRNYSTIVGLYKQTVAEQFVPYTRPQEMGNRTDVRWYELLDHDGKGIRVFGDQLLNMSALHFYDSDLDDGDKKHQRHAGELKPRKQTQLNIDLKQMGLGSVNSWGDLPLGQYLLQYKQYSYSFYIEPVNL
ncbi:MAG: DUF4981 domain-containing protein [Sphingobacteriales bacterium]|nr:MAG: DUF4981 domain-containing protein [Sphingobacteriales bacterium]